MKKGINRLLILGCGYVGEKLALAAISAGIEVIGTTRSQQRAAQLHTLAIEAAVVASPLDLQDELTPFGGCRGRLDSTKQRWIGTVCIANPMVASHQR